MQSGLVRCFLASVALAGCTGTLGGDGSPPSSQASSGAAASSLPGMGVSGALGASSGTPGAVAASGSGFGTPVGAPAQCNAAPLATGDAYVRRLTHWEYTNTVSDVLGWPAQTDQASLATLTGLLPADIHSNGFSNDYGGQLATLDAATAYQQAADAVGVALGTQTGWLAPFASCTTTVATCRDSIVQGLGLRLFRRPLTTTGTTSELASFGALFDTAVAAGMTTAPSAAVVVVRAMLQSPQFLYRLEAQLPQAAGAVTRPLDNYEIASRLSYFIASSAPDTALLSAAQAGQLTTPAQLSAQVTRLMALPEARIMAQRYFREWFFLDGLDDENRGPTFTTTLIAAMKQETLDDVGDQLWDKGQPVLSLFTTQKTLLNPTMAAYYGPAIGQPAADGSYSTAGLPGRMGFLTHAGVLTENGTSTASIVQRGLFMLRNVFCQNVPDPPPGATAVVLAPATASLRVQSAARLMTQPCVSCHGQFDPLAYAFEVFDNMGAWQTKDVNGNAVRQDGWLTVPGGANVPYATVADYMRLLPQDPRVSACIASKVSQFAWGRPMSAGDACMLQDIASRMGSPETTTFGDVISAIASSPYFVYTAVQ